MNNDGNSDQKDSWQLRTHRDVGFAFTGASLRIFSKVTPARPESAQATRTAMRPTWLFIWAGRAAGFCWRVSERDQTLVSVSGVLTMAGVEVACGTWMIDTPMMRRRRESHLRGDRVRPSISTLKMAVVRILSWYVTWNVAASRLLTATYWRVFCIV